ncbi:hypothetical protein AVEN_229480-1 [Araneus ventricosus]|uniref:DUF4817 domain-containing protein n=1 Tax=Araneus ventricosus TaxID=182803 RepID=A0A4Y2IYV9_ARAVE|nr:hypothetical protein AVEN_229480-1 [Araneus ventricosus]
MQIRRGPMSPCALCKMIQRFETTGQIGILPGKQIPSSSFEDVDTSVVEASSQSLHGSVSVPVIFRVLDYIYIFHCTRNLMSDFEFLSLQNQTCASIAGRGLRGLYNFCT